jgi:hypothetical protein
MVCQIPGHVLTFPFGVEHGTSCRDRNGEEEQEEKRGGVEGEARRRRCGEEEQ